MWGKQSTCQRSGKALSLLVVERERGVNKGRNKRDKGKRKMSEERSKRTMETSGGKKITVEIKRFENEKASLFDLGHPLLNSIADSFVKAAGVSFNISPMCRLYKMWYI